MTVDPPTGSAGYVDLHPAALQLLRASAGQLRAARSDLVEIIHQQLRAQVPDVVPRLSHGGDLVVRRLFQLIAQAATIDDPSARVADTVYQVGAENLADGLGLEYLASVPHVLLHSVRAAYPGDWSSALSSAWVEYLLGLSGWLQAGARAELALRQERAARMAEERRAEEPEEQADEDEDEDDVGFSGLMSAMTLDGKREPDRRRRGGGPGAGMPVPGADGAPAP